MSFSSKTAPHILQLFYAQETAPYKVDNYVFEIVYIYAILMLIIMASARERSNKVEYTERNILNNSQSEKYSPSVEYRRSLRWLMI